MKPTKPTKQELKIMKSLGFDLVQDRRFYHQAMPNARLDLLNIKSVINQVFEYGISVGKRRKAEIIQNVLGLNCPQKQEMELI